MDDIRDFGNTKLMISLVIRFIVERKTAEELKKKMRGEETIEGENQVQAEDLAEEALGKSFSSGVVD